MAIKLKQIKSKLLILLRWRFKVNPSIVFALNFLNFTKNKFFLHVNMDLAYTMHYRALQNYICLLKKSTSLLTLLSVYHIKAETQEIKVVLFINWCEFVVVGVNEFATQIHDLFPFLLNDIAQRGMLKRRCCPRHVSLVLDSSTLSLEPK